MRQRGDADPDDCERGGPDVTEATFVMVADLTISDDKKKRVEDALIAAITEAQAEGVTDPDVIRARMLAARDALRDG